MAFPTSFTNIERAEQALGRTLPAPLRDRLLANNGGEIETEDGEVWQLHPVWDDSNPRTIARTMSHVVHETKEAREWQRFPAGAIAIASDGSGNHLVLRSGSELVEDWNHETGECSAVSIRWKR